MEDIKFNFENLMVYQKSLDFITIVYSMCSKFPKMETNILTSKYRRAANAVSLNIAGGAGYSDAQCNKYLQIALDSTRECVACSTVAHRKKYIHKEQDQIARVPLADLSKMIPSLQNILKVNWSNY